MTRLTVPALLLCFGLVVRLCNASTGIDRLLRTTLPDDAFYYFGIARQVSLGHPPSIDGVNATNGYHPLWMAVLALVYRILGTDDPILPIRVALALGALLDTATAAVLYRVARRLGLSTWASTAALAIFVANPHQVVNATCGLETSLALFLALLVIHAELGAGPSTHPPAGLFGVLCGLAILARTDQALLVVCTIVHRTIVLRRGMGSRGAIEWALVVSGVAGAVFAPWAAYSLYTVGTLVQSSGVAMAFVHGHMPELWGIPHPSLALRLERTWASVAEAAAMISAWQGVGGGVFASATVVGLASALLSRGAPRNELLDRLRALSPMLVATALLFVAHAIVRAVFREWYTAPFIATLALLFGILLQHLATLSARPSWIATGAAAAIGLWAFRGAGDWGGTVYSQQRAGTPGARIREGHSDCGIVSYFTGGGITNLDGIVNQRALEALERGTLLDYVRSQHFQRVYVTDYYHSALFFGRGYRESIVGEGDAAAVRVVGSPIEKDARIGPTDAAVRLGDPAGREYLSDGWKWNSAESPTASSAGFEAEIVVYLPLVADDSELELVLSARVVGSRDVQPVAVSLNGRPIEEFDVARTPGLYTVPLRGGVLGRNRVQLRFGAAAPVRSPEAAWWRKLDGNLVLAVEAHTLLLRAGHRRSYEIALVGDAAARCDGCYPAEMGEKGRFRWTNGAATVHLPPLAIDDATECRLAVSTAVFASYYGVTWDHAPLQGANGNYLIPKDLRTGTEPHQVEIRSRVFVPAARGRSSDERTLGVALRGLTITCF